MATCRVCPSGGGRHHVLALRTAQTAAACGLGRPRRRWPSRPLCVGATLWPALSLPYCVGRCRLVRVALHPSAGAAPRADASPWSAASRPRCVSAASRPSAGAASRAGASPLSVPSRPGASRAYLYYRMRATGRLLRACAPCGAYAVRFEGRLGPFWASKAEKSYIFTSFKLPPPERFIYIRCFNYICLRFSYKANRKGQGAGCSAPCPSVKTRHDRNSILLTTKHFYT